MTTHRPTAQRPRGLSRARQPLHHRSPANQFRHDDLPVGARIADKVTAVFGSWGFILIQSFLIIIWLGYNGYAAVHYLHSNQFDPYPFILLNLLFSTQAAYAAPLILLSQNRTAERDRIKAEHDFDVNVLALRTLAELLGDVHDPTAQQRLRDRIDDLLGVDPDSQRGPRPDQADSTALSAPDEHRTWADPRLAGVWGRTGHKVLCPDDRRTVILPLASRCRSPVVVPPPRGC